MKAIFARSELINAIAPLMGSVSNKNTIAAIEGILIEADESGKCVLSTYDLEKGTRMELLGRVSEPGSYIISASRLNQMTRALPEGEITIEVDGNSNARISGGRSSFELPALKGEEFPGLPELNVEGGLSIKQGELKTMITQIMFAVAQNDPRTALNGALFQINGSRITIVSCDGNRLALKEKLCELEGVGEDNTQTEIKFIVPGKSLVELVKLADGGEAPMTIKLGRKHVVFKIDTVLFFTRLIDEEYIDYDRFIPKSNKIFAVVNSEEFISGLERASLVTEDRAMGHSGSSLCCEFEENILKISSNSQAGKFRDEIMIEKTGDDIEIHFNCRFLLDALKVCHTETVKLSMNTPLMSMIIQPFEESEDEKFLFLVLPVKKPVHGYR